MQNGEENEITSMRISRKTRDKVASIGNKDDSFDEIVDRLANFWIRYKDVVDQRK